MRASWFDLLACCALCASVTAGAEFLPSRPAEEVIGAGTRTTTPIVVCPPRYSTPIFVPADEVLRQAEELQPATPDGWIIQNRNVPDCRNCLDDAETRAYQLFGYPLKLRQYDTQIRLLEAEVASWQRKLAEYDYFNKAGALMITVENTRLTLLDTQERLRNLRFERMLFLRQRSLEQQLRQGVPVEPRPYGAAQQ